ncbi:replication protein P [Pontibacterium granulatum]|uniref:replication protein P n=1 Tax=Pontibacterium granulatum TaxID=2036029 RepID=UPI00249C15F3|nr:replication protein P [Pontibacterium granulatum]MDI3323322.1 replication protein P [Pontibacterium granulatum]
MPVNPQGHASGQAQPQPISNETKTLVNMIFARFMAIYGHKFKSCFETQDELRLAKREWALSLRGYNESELVVAIDRCKESLAWMPSVSEFLAILQELRGDHGLPASRNAYVEACMHADHPTKHTWSHPAVYQAGKATGWFRLRTEDEANVVGDFNYHYQVMCQRVRDGENLEEAVPMALEDKSDNTLVDFIQRWGEEQNLEPTVAAKLLYYLMKPKGSATRQRFKEIAQKDADALGIQLPEDYQ